MTITEIVQVLTAVFILDVIYIAVDKMNKHCDNLESI